MAIILSYTKLCILPFLLVICRPQVKTSVAILGGTVAFLSKLRQSFHDICISSKIMTKKLGFQIRFNEAQLRAKKLFHEELASDYPLESPRNQFRVNVFLCVVDVFLSQLKTRFESLHEVVDVSFSSRDVQSFTLGFNN